jgi:CheY-like chemotaxis protein
MEIASLRLFAQKRVLIVEDDYFLADDTRCRLEWLGVHIIGPTSSIPTAVAIAQTHSFDAAILDIHINGELAFPVALELITREIPFVFATGYERVIIPGAFAGYALCTKPLELADIARTLFGCRTFDTRH